MTVGIRKIDPITPAPSKRVQTGAPIPRPGGQEEAARRLREWQTDPDVPSIDRNDHAAILRNLDGINAGRFRIR